MNPAKSILLAVVLSLVLVSGSHAGPYTDDLSKCLVEATTSDDRADLVKWMFSAMALHPAVASISSVTDEQLDRANEKVADLIVNLLTDSCRQETQEAVRFEGTGTIQNSFKILGEVAARELFSSPEVAAGMAGLEKHFDEERLQSVFEK